MAYVVASQLPEQGTRVKVKDKEQGKRSRKKNKEREKEIKEQGTHTKE